MIQLNNISFFYEKKPVFSGINLKIPPGFSSIAGMNGSGKTTLGYILSGIIPRHIKGILKGNVSIDGISINKYSQKSLSQKIGYLFQNPDFTLFNQTILEELNFPVKNFGLNIKKTEFLKILNKVRLNKNLQTDPQELSFGEKQKLALASVLILNPEILILDEPISQLDYPSAIEIYGILKKFAKSGKTVITIEHDSDFINHFSDSVFLIHEGKIRSFSSPKEAFKNRALLKKAGVRMPFLLHKG